jgi:hypothetical protein
VPARAAFFSLAESGIYKRNFMPSTFRQRKGSRAGRAFLLLAMVVLGAVPAANAGSPTYAHVLASRAALESSVARNVPHHILVKFKAGVSRALISRVERRAGLRTIHRFGSFAALEPAGRC